MKKSSFSNRVYRVVRNIPKGSVLTYMQVARMAGSPRACRAVGNILHTNTDPHIPCHRVVRSDGTLGGYNRGVSRKKTLLVHEGVVLSRKKL